MKESVGLPRYLKFIGVVFLAVFALLSAAVDANAYLQNWTPPYYPEVMSTGDQLTYKYSGAGGTLNVSGGSLTLYAPKSNPKYQYYPVTNGKFALTAQFSETGAFQSGSLTITGTDKSKWPGHTIASSYTLEEVWFDGSGRKGTMEFLFANNQKNSNFYGLDQYLYVYVTESNLTGWRGTWDPTNNNNPIFWETNHSASHVTTTTWAPIPSSVWLLGSGLLGMAAARRK